MNTDAPNPPRRNNSLHALMRLKPMPGSEWNVVAYVLNKDMINSDGVLDHFYGVMIPLGSFRDRDKAEEHAKNLIAITGHPGITVVRYGYPLQLTTKFDPTTVTMVNVDTKGKIVDLESAQYKEDMAEYERQTERDREITKEAEEETNPDSIEHFKRQCYLAVKNRSTYEIKMTEAKEAWTNYEKRKHAVQDHYQRHPDHETTWLPYLKDKLTHRGETKLYRTIKHGYDEIRDELLGLNSSPSETVVEPSSETDVEPSSETVVEPSSETDVEPSSETVVEPPSETVVEPPSETVVEPSSETDVEPSSETVVEPPSETVVEPPSETVVEPPSETVVEPPSETVVEPPSETVVEPPSETVVEPPSETVVEPPSETDVESSSEIVVEPPSETVVEPSSKTVVEPHSDECDGGVCMVDLE
jgi:hypothetical protein